MRSTIPGVLRDKTFRTLLIAFLLLNFATRLILLLRPLPFLDGKLLPDDTYLSLEIAKNIALGNGPLYADNFTNGFQPLYVFLVAPIFAFSTDQMVLPIKLALLLLTVFETATLAVLMIWVQRLTRTAAITCLVAVFWIFNDYILRTSLNGLETMVATFFVVSACYLFYLIYYAIAERESYHFLLLGVIVGFACFARVDSGILAVTFGALILFYEYSNFRVMLVRASLYSLGVLVIFSIWIAYSVYYTGMWYPESGRAVRFVSLWLASNYTPWMWYVELGRIAMYAEWRANGILALMTAVMGVFLLLKRDLMISFFRQIKYIAPILIFSVVVFLAYMLYIFTYWYFERYFFPITILSLLIFALLLNTLLLNSSYRRRIWTYAALVVVWFTFLFERGRFLDYYVGDPDPNLGYMNLGIWASTNFPPGTVVGACQSGAVKYFAPKLKVINLDGVVNKDSFEALVRKEAMDYIKKAGIEYLLAWDGDLKYIREHSKEFNESDIIPMGEITGPKTSYWSWHVYKIKR